MKKKQKNIEMPDKSFWDEIEKNIRMMPQLPELELEKEGMKYTMTDVRYLNQMAVECFLMVLNNVIENDQLEEQEISFKNELTDDQYRVISDILMQIGVSAEDSDDDYVHGTVVVSGTRRQNNKIIVKLLKDHAEIIRDLGQKKIKNREEINYFLFMIEFADELMRLI